MGHIQHARGYKSTMLISIIFFSSIAGEGQFGIHF